MRVGRPGHFVGSDDFAELSNALANFGFLQARITKHQALARVPQEISGYTVNSYAVRRRLFDDGLFGSATVEPEHDVDARAVAGHLHAIAQIFVIASSSAARCEVLRRRRRRKWRSYIPESINSA